MTYIEKTIQGALFSLFLFSTSALSSDLESLYGQWGNESQCGRALITPTGTKHFTPFDIQHDWLEYGGVWCRLIWSTERTTSKGLSVMASARCGEDTPRDYWITFDLIGSELTLMWDRDFENGPLSRCAR